MLVQLGAPPLAGFDRPLAMLADCHRRIEHFLDVLRRIQDNFGGRELSPDARRGLVAAVEYFRDSAPRHTADEEESLFPRLRSVGGQAASALSDLDALEHDHRRMEAEQDAANLLVEKWLVSGSLAAEELTELRNLLNNLAAAYSTHIRLEEERLFPLAAESLRTGKLKAIGREMQQRRGLRCKSAANDGPRLGRPV